MIAFTSRILLRNVFFSSFIRRSFLTASFPELSKFPKTITNRESLLKYSIENNDEFWGILAKSRLQWFNVFNEVKSGNFADKNFNLKWFLDGKLNVSGITISIDCLTLI